MKCPNCERLQSELDNCRRDLAAGVIQGGKAIAAYGELRGIIEKALRDEPWVDDARLALYGVTLRGRVVCPLDGTKGKR